VTDDPEALFAPVTAKRTWTPRVAAPDRSVSFAVTVVVVNSLAVTELGEMESAAGGAVFQVKETPSEQAPAGLPTSYGPGLPGFSSHSVERESMDAVAIVAPAELEEMLAFTLPSESVVVVVDEYVEFAPLESTDDHVTETPESGLPNPSVTEHAMSCLVPGSAAA
jgi:hypothetical protein